MSKLIGWRAWYEGGRVFDSAGTRWEELPATGVVGFVEYEDTQTPTGFPTRRIVANGDYFWLDEKTGRIEKTATSETRGEWVARPSVVGVKAGAWVEDDEYDRARAQMSAATKAPR